MTDPDDVLSVSIPLEEPQRPLLGQTIVLPCYFEVGDLLLFFSPYNINLLCKYLQAINADQNVSSSSLRVRLDMMLNI